MTRHHYSDKLSTQFWRRINRLSESEPAGSYLYVMGCNLQDDERRMLRMLEKAERDAKAKGRP